jgi:hypothetical protein
MTKLERIVLILNALAAGSIADAAIMAEEGDEEAEGQLIAANVAYATAADVVLGFIED